MKRLLGLFLLLSLACAWAAADDGDANVDFDQGAPSIKVFKNAAGQTCESLGSATLCDSNGGAPAGQASEVIVTGQAQQQPAPSVGAVAPNVTPSQTDPAVEGAKCRQLNSGPNSILCDNTLVDAAATSSCASRYSAMTNTEGGAVLYALCRGLASMADADAAFTCFRQWRSAAAMRGVPTDLDDANICRNDPAQGQAFAAYTDLGPFYQSSQLTSQNLWQAVRYTTNASRTVSCVQQSVSAGDGPSPWNTIQPCVAPPPNPDPAW